MSLEISIDIECADCGDTLEASFNNRNNTFEITPCPGCLENAKSDSRDEEYQNGWDDGYKDGYSLGKKESEEFESEKP